MNWWWIIFVKFAIVFNRNGTLLVSACHEEVCLICLKNQRIKESKVGESFKGIRIWKSAQKNTKICLDPPPFLANKISPFIFINNDSFYRLFESWEKEKNEREREREEMRGKERYSILLTKYTERPTLVSYVHRSATEKGFLIL